MPANNSRKFPSVGFAVAIDGVPKAEFLTKEGAEQGARQLKQRFPLLQIKIYDAASKASYELP